MTTDECNLLSALLIARSIPIVIFGVVVYGCWVFTRVLCIDWLISPPDPGPAPRPATAVGLIVLYYTTLVPFLLAYAILYVKVVWNNDFVDYGPDHESKSASVREGEEQEKELHRRSIRKLHTPSSASTSITTEKPKTTHASLESADAFYLKDAYLCTDDGRPPWCSVCSQFKTDRTHHCKEVNRCVRKMDHFCPWVGGVVAESSFKSFVQFLGYALCYVAVNFAIFVAYTCERKKLLGGYVPHWIVAIGISSFLGLFVGAMLVGTMHNALLNLTTIESINRKTRNYTIALHVPRTCRFNTQHPSSILCLDDPRVLCTISFPNAADPKFNAHNMPLLHGQTRTFVVVRTQKGESPFDLGSWSANWRELMGYSVFEWFLPGTRSPCQNHAHAEGLYRVGPVVQRLRREYGLEPGYAADPSVAVPASEDAPPVVVTAAGNDSDMHVEDGSAGASVHDVLLSDTSAPTTPTIPRSSSPAIAPAPPSLITPEQEPALRARSHSRSHKHRRSRSRASSRASTYTASKQHHHRRGSSAESQPASVAASGSESVSVSSGHSRANYERSREGSRGHANGHANGRRGSLKDEREEEGEGRLMRMGVMN